MPSLQKKIYTLNDLNTLPDPSDQGERIHIRRRGKRSTRKIIILVLVVLLFAVVQVTAPSKQSNENNNDNLSIFEQLKRFLSGERRQLKGTTEDRVNFLVLGMGGAGHEGPNLTDTNILVSYQPSTQKIALLSIPRDLAVYIPKYGFQKINSVNAWAESEKEDSGGEMTRLIVSELFNVEIPYFVRIDFSFFRQVIDEIGGVVVDVERSFTDTKYPAPDFAFQTITFEKGRQHMSGETALMYIRSRHGCCGEDGDFARARRQQRLLQGLKEQMMDAQIWQQPQQIIKLYNNYRQHVLTNLKVWEMFEILALLKQAQNRSLVQLTLANSKEVQLETIIGAEGSFMLQPKDGDYKKLVNVATNMFHMPDDVTLTNTPSLALTTLDEEEEKTPSIMVLNGTSINGLAGKTSQMLKEKGFHITQIGNAPVRTYEINYIYDTAQGKYPKTLKALTQELDATASSEIPEWLLYQLNSPDGDILNEQIDFVIVIGANG